MISERHIISKREQYRCGWRFSGLDGKRIITIGLRGKPTEVKVMDDDEGCYYIEELKENE